MGTHMLSALIWKFSLILIFFQQIMICVTPKVLLFRYLFVLQQKVFLTISYILLPLVLCIALVMWFDSLPPAEFHVRYSRIQDHDARTILLIPEDSRCILDPSICQLDVFVYPGGEKEQELMRRVDVILRLSNKSPALKINLVGSLADMDAALVRSSENRSRGVHFHQITPNELEYTIRPRVLTGIAKIYDWYDYATSRRFPSPMERGPRVTDAYFNVETEFISVSGLLALQVAIDQAYIQLYFPDTALNWILTSFPHPNYWDVDEKKRPLSSMSVYLSSLQYVLMMGNIYMVLVFALYVISDRGSGIREWMYVNGANRFVVNIAWLISFCFESTILAICETVFLKLPSRNGAFMEFMSSPVLLSVLILHYWTVLSWVYLIATFFSAQSARVYVVVLFIIAYFVGSTLFKWIPPGRFVMQGIFAVLPNAGLTLIFKSYQEYDGAATVLVFSRLSEYTIHYLPVGTLMLIMLMTIVVIIVVSAYVDFVKPGPYGRARPWYFFQRKKRASNDDSFVDDVYFQELGDAEVAFTCVDVAKYFGKFTALDNVSMKILKNKTTVILGRNGAGKTTFLNILCGLISPTKGFLTAEDYDVHRNLRKFRKLVGYCPQQNWLMKELTVRQHCILFGMLKGLTRSQAVEYCNEWAQRFDMDKFQKTKSEHLSDGAKRKLCIAIATIGNPRYLLLDEPTASLDSKSKQTLWNGLLKDKHKFTIVLVTHNMKEAEALSDYTAFLENGQLKGYGTSEFIKKQLNMGYTVTCSQIGPNAAKLMKIITNFDKSTKVLSKSKETMTFGFPINKTKDLAGLLKKLESEFEGKILVSLSYASMGDAFTKLQSNPTSSATSKTLHNILSSTHPPDTNLEITEKNKRAIFKCCHITEIFKKRAKWILRRKITALAFLVVLPPVGTYLAMYFLNYAIVGGLNATQEKLKLTMDAYSGSTGYIVEQDNAVADKLKQAFKDNQVQFETTPNMAETLKTKAGEDLFNYRSKMVFAFHGSPDLPIAYYSRNAFHAAPIAYSTLINAMLGNATITTYIYPFSGSYSGNCSFVVNALVNNAVNPFLSTLGPVFLLLGSYFVIFPHLERKYHFKHLQLMTGMLPGVYWVSNLIFDAISFLVSSLLMIAVLACMDDGLFVNSTTIPALSSVLFLYGISAIVFSYLWSFSKLNTSIVVITLSCVPALLFFTYALLFKSSGTSYTLQDETLFIIPWVPLMSSLEKISLMAFNRILCVDCKVQTVCSQLQDTPWYYSLKRELLYFVVCFVCYFTLIVALDHGFWRKLKPMFDRVICPELTDDQEDVDPDVAKERKRVIELMKDESEHELCCFGLVKRYSSNIRYKAVSGVSFALEQGEMLGLLGPNGSGKSTVLGILSGLVIPTKGNAAVRNTWELSDCEYNYIKNMSICPQFHGYLPGLTAEEMLFLFGRLRGLKRSVLGDHVNAWLDLLELKLISRQPCDTYNGGNLRKLSFAIAMIARPPIVFLDEPVAGVDIVARKAMKEILVNNSTLRDQSIIITSHMLADFEDVCDRVTILVDGKMMRIGTLSHLRSKVGKICILSVKIKPDAPPDQRRKTELTLLKDSPFSRHATIIEKQPTFILMSINANKITMHDVAEEMLRLRGENTGVEDFSLSEIVGLEEIIGDITQQPAIKTQRIK